MRFFQRVYTQAEQQDCGYWKTRPVAPINQLAGRWAAKEAAALGTGGSYTDIEIRRQPSGAPAVHLHRQAAVVAVWEKVNGS